ncbi:MAG: alpha/beta fold hydrolase [Planctomycetota bacterium]|nr:alpha/beta fold hydrolase [Planctomycetota bacterium]
MLTAVRPLALTITLACVKLAAQCSDPMAPASGFAITTATNQLLTYTDGYRTRADVYRPTTAPGPCGWPLLIAVHGLPSTKQAAAARATDFAQRGYLVVAYDVRGQGSGIALNPGKGSGIMSLQEWIDMFEVIEWARSTYPNLVDNQRVGVFGVSQGGAHAWAAAAWSGRQPPPNPRRSTAFPTVNAVAATAMPPSHPDAATLKGAGFKAVWARYAYAPTGPMLAVDPAVKLTWRTFLANDDPEGNYLWLKTDPGRDFSAELQQSAVPTLVTMSWRDNGVGADPSLAALQSMPASTPKRLYVTTGQHDTPPNDYEFDQQLRMRERWFARFLKADPEPIEDGPLVRSAALPADAATYTDPTSLWRHRADDSLPPQVSSTSRLFLRAGGALSTQAPTTSEAPQRITHQVPPGYTALQWGQSGGGTAVAPTLNVTPLSEHVYTSAPFAETFEIAGLPTLELALTPMSQRFFVAARLDLIPPSGGAVTVGRGAAGERQAGGPSPTTLSIGLDLLDVVVPAGTRLQLRVRNHYIVNTPQGEYFHTMPYLSGYDVDVEHSPGALSFVDLPLRNSVELDLTTAATALSVSAPATVDVELRSAPTWASSVYFVAMSLSGQGPALPLPGGDLLWLRPDGLTTAALGPNPLLPGFIGVLDADGAASASMQLLPIAPLPAGLAGTNLHLAPMAFQGADLHAGAPVSVELRP